MPLTRSPAASMAAKSMHEPDSTSGVSVRRPAQTAERIDEVPAVGALCREDDHVRLEVEDLRSPAGVASGVAGLIGTPT